jgi:hypothetical protein
VAPSRSRAQREDALRRATAVRRQRAQLKRDLKSGRCAIEEVLSDPPAFVQTAKVADLLLAVPKYGPVKVNKLLSRCRIAPNKTIGGLSDRQRNELAALLADRASRRTLLPSRVTSERFCFAPTRRPQTLGPAARSST